MVLCANREKVVCMKDESLQDVRCPRCGRYKGCGQFSILEMKCEKCKLRFEVKCENGKTIFRNLDEGQAATCS